MTFFPPWNKYFLFRKNVTVWCFLRKISSSQISVLFEIALQSVLEKIHNKLPVVMSSVKLCYTFFPISSHNEYTDANVTFHYLLGVVGWGRRGVGWEGGEIEKKSLRK